MSEPPSPNPLSEAIRAREEAEVALKAASPIPSVSEDQKLREEIATALRTAEETWKGCQNLKCLPGCSQRTPPNCERCTQHFVDAVLSSLSERLKAAEEERDEWKARVPGCRFCGDKQSRCYEPEERDRCRVWADQQEVDRILAMSGEELRAEIIAEGRDPDAVAEGMRREVSAAIELANRATAAEAEASRLRDDNQRLRFRLGPSARDF